MRPATLVAALGLAVLVGPARGDDITPDALPTTLELQMLTRMDSVPTRDEVIAATTISRLRGLATSADVDLGLQLRAIRALTHYCEPDCQPDDAGDHPAHAAILDIVRTLDPDTRTPSALLRLRAAIEALGLLHSGTDEDVATLIEYLGDASRDIRTTAVRALRETCNPMAIGPLRIRHSVEPVPQVKHAISSALRDLAQCTPAR